jgi:CO/xanthine dehydrogenase Mo-binding subunit
VVDSKDVEATLAKATSTVSATYHHPYQMHGSLGSSCAVADVKDGKATIWSASQAVHPLRQTVAMMLGVPAADVRVIFRMGSGCYGLNGADTVSYDAALMSQAEVNLFGCSSADRMKWPGRTTVTPTSSIKR